MAAKKIFNYNWNYNTLKRIYFQLKFKERTEDEQREYLFLETILANGHVIEGISFVDDSSFQDKFKYETKTLMVDYYDYLAPIFEFYDNTDDEIETMTYEYIDVSEEELIEAANKFFKSLDENWYQLFLNLYNNRNGTVSFTNARSFSTYFPSNNMWLANITRNNTIQDYVNTIHEFAHGIADQMVPQIKTYSSDNIFIELFPIVLQMIWLYECDEHGLQLEINKYMNNYLKIMSSYAEEIRMKYNIASSFVDVNTPRNLCRLIRRTWGINISKEEVSQTYNNPVEELFNYVFPFLCAIELVDLYRKDKDKFIHTMNRILVSDLKPLEILEKFDIEPNKNLKK